MVLEIAVFTARPGHAEQFAEAYREAGAIISAAPGCRSARMLRGVEHLDRFTLLVDWETIEAHMEGFRGSEQFGAWRTLLEPHFDAVEMHHVAEL